MRTHPLLLASATLFVVPLALAEIQRDLDAHEHDAATLDVVVDGSSVFIDLESPMANLVGFEHAPSTDDQHAAIDKARQRLADAGSLFMPAGGDCSAETDEAIVVREEGHGNDHDGDHDADGHENEHEGDHDAEGHEDGHDADGHGEEDHDEASADGHDDAHADAQDGGAVHSEARASFRLDCADIGSLESIDVTLLEIWPDIESLVVQLAGPAGQHRAELSPDARVLDLSPIL